MTEKEQNELNEKLFGTVRNEAEDVVTSCELIAAGGDVGTKDNEGREPFHFAEINLNASAAHAHCKAGCRSMSIPWPFAKALLFVFTAF